MEGREREGSRGKLLKKLAEQLRRGRQSGCSGGYRRGRGYVKNVERYAQMWARRMRLGYIVCIWTGPGRKGLGGGPSPRSFSRSLSHSHGHRTPASRGAGNAFRGVDQGNEAGFCQELCNLRARDQRRASGFRASMNGDGQMRKRRTFPLRQMCMLHLSLYPAEDLIGTERKQHHNHRSAPPARALSHALASLPVWRRQPHFRSLPRSSQYHDNSETKLLCLRHPAKTRWGGQARGAKKARGLLAEPGFPTRSSFTLPTDVFLIA